MGISLRSSGSTARTEAYLNRMSKIRLDTVLDSYAREGVNALARATPIDTGLASGGWDYEIRNTGSSVSITWTNRNIEGGFPVAIMLQYGYSTGTGGYVAGRDYINPAMRPIFDRIADAVWKELTNG